jgi:DNA mismatch repair ATPase MutS
MWLVNLSHSALFSILVYLPLQVLFLIDFHFLLLMEHWQTRNREHAPHWFRALGELEALLALALLKRNHPSWCLPQVDVAAQEFTARELGHPLLIPTKCVLNDVQLGPAGELLLVTGSNMSGKSTLLRAVGLNIVLAQAGGPTCATILAMPPVELATSMRVRDSLTEGVSFYMAELRRLKEVVDLARQYHGRADRRLLFLLDEILLGTNSRERHIAVEHVLGHLIGQGALGAVTTHDLDLANSPVLSAHARCVHFKETYETDAGQQRMSFDYRLRQGVCTTTNALKLLKIVGLDDS